MDKVRSANWHTGSAVDATVGLDVELRHGFEFRFILLGMNAIGRAYLYAEEILDAGVGDYISHDENSLE